MDRLSRIELQKIDCNCNDCIFMERDLVTYKKWEDWHRKLDLEEFERAKAKAIADALAVTDIKSRKSMLNIAEKMKFQFQKSNLLNYGKCKKFNKPVSFIPNICQIETQECFVHRHDQKLLIKE